MSTAISTPSAISEKQLEANRRNALRSTGPKTEVGKCRARMNALTHGLTAEPDLLPEADREAHDQFCAALLAEFRPEGELETQLAQSVADDHWRLNRARAIEDGMFALGQSQGSDPVRSALDQAQTFLDHARQFGLLTMYEGRISRNAQRALDQLRSIQKERKARRQAELEAVCQLAAVQETNGLPFDPAQNGLGFSIEEIALHRDRTARLAEAKRNENLQRRVRSM